jgi:hypothetical protein
MLALIIIGILVVIIVIGFFLGRSGTLNPKGTPTQEKTEAEKKYSAPDNAYLPPSVWSDFVPNAADNNAGSGNCLNYTQSSTIASIGVPCINGNGCLNSSGPGSYYISNQSCTDPDQIMAQAGVHNCNLSNNGSAGTGCIASTTFTHNSITYNPGDLVPVGAIEGIGNPYFIPCGNTACQGTIGLIIPNFTPLDTANQINSNPNKCISFDENGIDNNSNIPAIYDTMLSTCDLRDFKQIFRMTRYSLNADYSFTQDDNGIYAALIFRANGFYLSPELNYKFSLDDNGNLTDPVYYFDSPVFTTFEDCTVTASPVTRQYIKLILIDPQNDTVRNGIYWLLQNQTPNATLQSDQVDPTNFLGCLDSKQDPPGTYIADSYPVPVSHCNNQITGIPSWFQPEVTPSIGIELAYQGESAFLPISPQQLVYIPNIYLVPKDNTNLQEYWTYLTNQYSIQIGNIGSNNTCTTVSQKPVLLPYLTNMPANIYSGVDNQNNNRICGVSQASTLDTVLNPLNKPVIPKDNQFIPAVSYVPQMLSRISNLQNISSSIPFLNLVIKSSSSLDNACDLNRYCNPFNLGSI